MKVMQINCVYKKGSTGKIMYDIHTELKKHGIESVVCYGRGKKIIEPGVYKTSSEIIAKFNNIKSRFTGMPYGGCFFATNKLFGIIKKQKPDVVHLHCINGFFVNIYRLINFLKRNKIPTVLTNHAEFMYTANCGYAYDCEKYRTGCGNCPDINAANGSILFDFTKKSNRKMRKAFADFDKLFVVGVSDWVSQRAQWSKMFDKAQFFTIHNGIETEKIFHRNYDAETIFEKYGIEKNKKIILHVTSGFEGERKGGNYLLQLAENMKRKSEFHFVVVGCTQTVADKKNITFVKHTENQQELATFYLAASVFVITSKNDNYPTVCVEAASCGTPVVGFDVGGVAETIPNGMGEIVPFGDVEALEKKTVFWANNKINIPENIIQNARKYNNKTRMTDEYIEIYKKLTERH